MMFLNQIEWWLIFILLSLFLSGMEEAFVSSDKIKYALEKKKKGFFNFFLNKIYGHPREFMAVLSVANLLALIFFVLSSIQIFKPYIDAHITTSPIFTYIILVIFISLIILITGEFLPRTLFHYNADLWVKILIIPSFILYMLLYPITKVLIIFSKVFLGWFGLKVNISEEKLIGRVELDTLVKQGIEEFPEKKQLESEVQIFKNALDFSNMKIKDCMVPRADIVAVSYNSDIQYLKEKFIETGLSRILVYEETIDNIVGYIHIWELINTESEWTKKIADISFMPESMPASKLMSELMQESKSMAVVVDEFGGTSGIVTMEDLVEEIFGDIEDEYDINSGFVKQESENSFVISGRVEIDTLNENYGMDLPESEDYSTIAGLILHYTQRFPKTYEIIHVNDFQFQILKVTSRKIEVLRLTHLDKTMNDEISN